MPYDPEKIEDWVVGCDGFWRAGDVNANQYIRPFTGTWEQVRRRMQDMSAMVLRHAEERRALAERQSEERKLYWS